MTYETFQQEVLKGLQNKQLGDVSLTKKLKCNGQLKTGIVFNNSVTNTSPVIYLEEYYDFYRKTRNLPEIIEMISSLYHSLPAVTVNTQEFFDFSIVKSRIIMKLINTKKNRTFLETVPHLPFNDLSIVYYYFIGYADGKIVDMPITDELLKKWDINTLTLHQHAVENYGRLLPAKFLSLKQYLMENRLLGTENFQADTTSAAASASGLDDNVYILSNERMFCGAVLMASKNIMDQVADFFGEDFYILPSSTHEVLVMPASKVPSVEELNQTVQEVNRTQVAPEDYLSDHVYYYSKSEQSSNPNRIQNLFHHSLGIIF